ncbi:MAG: MgtC/SapB family protein [Holophagales bacterium]|nr:MgtC/SapB family protein [Holophagales bacterium]
MNDRIELLRLAIAAIGGLAVGIEREWSARQERDHTRFGGVRTFLLLGLVGGLAGLLYDQRRDLALLVFAGGLTMVAIAYLVSAWRGTIDATTEVAGVVVLSAGALAGVGALEIASAVFAGTALVLVEKSRMHRAVERIQSAELEAAARFAVLALVVLPLLPAGPFGPPPGLEPRKLWALVLVFAGLSFVGYVALRIAGPRRGLGLAGLLGGMVSSTAVTLNFARDARRDPALAAPLALGVLAASSILPLRVLVLSAVIHAPVALALALAVVPAIAVGGAVVVWMLLRERKAEERDAETPRPPGNPLRLGAAMQMTAVFAIVLYLLALVQERFGEAGVLGGSALLGLTDLDALTYSAGRLASAGGAPEASARALIVGMLANTLFKAAIAATVGPARFRRVVLGGFAIYLVAIAAGWLLV